MADREPVLILWPVTIIQKVRAIAKARHTTASEIVRQAVIEKYDLAEPIEPVESTK